MSNQKDIFPVKWEFSGDFSARAEKLWERLHTPGIYSPDAVFHPATYGWQGDFEGRTMLAWALLGRLLGKSSPYLAEVLKEYPDQINEQGFFGKIFNPDILDEQQYGGHGWLLRALTESYLNTGDGFFADSAKKILNNMVIPVLSRISTYPITDGARDKRGEASGTSDRQIGSWLVSTDIGAVFNLFDGAVHAAEVFKMPLDELLIDTINVFRKIDILKMRMQTHATLSFTRGVIRLYEKNQDQRLLDYAEKVFNLYLNYGMTENYANYNWFGRPEWTEPCAVIDSFMAAMSLARLTGKAEYLDTAHHIWFSGVEAGQRDSGGMGCDTCLRDDQELLNVRFPEATWCCTMRAGEGFYACGANAVMRRGSSLFINLPLAGKYTFADGLTVQLDTDYPVSAAVTVKILAKGSEKIEEIKVFTVGNGWENAGTAHDKYPVICQKTLHGGANCFRRGPVMMGKRKGSEQLVPINNGWKIPVNELKELPLKAIFADSEI